MEKYYVVPKETDLHTKYFAYKENLKTVNEDVKDFMLSHGIKSTEYWCSSTQFAIVPTEEDIKSFSRHLRQGKDKNGLRLFRKDSFITKEWTEKNIKVLDKPHTMFSFSGNGRSSSRLFDINGILYCSRESEYDFECLEQFHEIKASEFFKVIEDAQKM
jgi:hypothetical protein